MARWFSFFPKYSFELKYKPGKQICLDDALSGRPDYDLAHVTTLSSSVTDFIRTALAKDEQFVALLRALGYDEVKDSDINFSARLRVKLHRYSIDQGLLCYSTDVEDIPRIVVPHDAKLSYRIIYEAQDTAVSGDLGREKIYSSVSQCYCGPNSING